MSVEFECEQPAGHAGRIIVLHDEVRRLDTLQGFLASQGFEVRTVGPEQITLREVSLMQLRC